MSRNYLIIAIRNLMKQKIFTFINVLGLAVGVACCMILGLYVHHELGYDRHHPNAENIYRVVRENIDRAGNRSFITGTSGPLTPVLRTEVPGIRTCVRLMTMGAWVGTNEKVFKQAVCLADPEILNVFDLPLVRGDHQTALTTPNGLLVTESIAQKYFGQADPIGRVVRTEDGIEGEYTITGVLEDLPETSLLQFDFLTSHHMSDRLKRIWEMWRIRFPWMPIKTYVVLEPTARTRDIEHQLVSLVPRYAGEEVRDRIRHHLQPIVRAHLFAKQDYGFSLQGKGDIRRLYVATILGGFILLLAVINFVNLSTARSTLRAKEVGMRKVVGAYRGQIVRQFLGESILLSMLAHLFAVVMVQLSLPWVSSWIGITLSVAQTIFWFLLPISVLIIGLLAGSCPAFFISKLRPVAALKGQFLKEGGGTSLRRGLVLFQFSISVLLIAGTWVVFSQWQFMVEKDPGYDKEHVVILPIFSADGSLFDITTNARHREVRQRFLKHPNVLSACATNNKPIQGSRFTVRSRRDERRLAHAFF